MSLAGDLAAASKRPAYLDRGCMVCRVVRSLEGTEDGEALVAALAASIMDMPHVTIERVLVENGYRVTPDALTKHRNGKCVGTR